MSRSVYNIKILRKIYSTLVAYYFVKKLIAWQFYDGVLVLAISEIPNTAKFAVILCSASLTYILSYKSYISV